MPAASYGFSLYWDSLAQRFAAGVRRLAAGITATEAGGQHDLIAGVLGLVRTGMVLGAVVEAGVGASSVFNVGLGTGVGIKRCPQNHQPAGDTSGDRSGRWMHSV